METVTDFIFLGWKTTAEGDCSHEIKRHLLLGRKAMTSLESILKSWDITLPTKVHLIKAMVFPVLMYRCECWSIRKAKYWRTDTFELWYWRKLLRIPWTARRSKQWIPKEINLALKSRLGESTGKGQTGPSGVWSTSRWGLSAFQHVGIGKTIWSLLLSVHLGVGVWERKWNSHSRMKEQGSWSHADLTWNLGLTILLISVTAAMKLKDAYSLEGKWWPT